MVTSTSHPLMGAFQSFAFIYSTAINSLLPFLFLSFFLFFFRMVSCLMIAALDLQIHVHNLWRLKLNGIFNLLLNNTRILKIFSNNQHSSKLHFMLFRTLIHHCFLTYKSSLINIILYYKHTLDLPTYSSFFLTIFPCITGLPFASIPF